MLNDKGKRERIVYTFTRKKNAEEEYKKYTKKQKEMKYV